MNPIVISAPTHDLLLTEGAELIKARFEARPLKIIIAGGRAVPVMTGALTKASLLQDAALFLADERLPLGSPQSNIPALQAHLGSEATLLVPHGASPLTEAIREYGERYRNTPASGTLALLSVGEDGHVASLFGGLESATIKHQAGTLVHVKGAPKPPSSRISFSLATFMEQDLVVLFFLGSAKRAPLKRALEGEASGPLGELIRGTNFAILTDQTEEVDRWRSKLS